MLVSTRRQAQTLVWALIAVLALVFVGLTVYQVRSRDHSEVNEERLKELTGARWQDERPGSGDWPQWRGPNRDGVSAETGLLRQWPEGGPKVLWTAATGEGFSSVV